MNTYMGLWITFGVVVVLLVVLDLISFKRNPEFGRIKSLVIWCLLWVSAALGYNYLIYHIRGSQPALEFLTGYLIEWSLSMDNLFVFAVIFSFFSLPPRFQHRVLFWGIWGAVVLRLFFVFAGVALIRQFHWMETVFGAFLVLTGLKLAFFYDKKVEPGKNPVLRFAKKFLPLTSELHGEHFMIRQQGKRVFTPMFLVLLVVETTDVMFAVDSVPAIFAITSDPFIIYTSNVFAILGLRSFYFLLIKFLGSFYYLNVGLAVILVFIGTKMLIREWYAIPTVISLGSVALILVMAVVFSLLFPKKETHRK